MFLKSSQNIEIKVGNKYPVQDYVVCLHFLAVNVRLVGILSVWLVAENAIASHWWTTER